MQAIKCELCGSNQLIKKDGYYQCEYCGTKYTLEEAKKLIVSGTVEVVTGNAEKERLLKNAETLINLEKTSDAHSIYGKIISIYPDEVRGYVGKLLLDIDLLDKSYSSNEYINFLNQGITDIFNYNVGYKESSIEYFDRSIYQSRLNEMLDLEKVIKTLSINTYDNVIHKKWEQHDLSHTIQMKQLIDDTENGKCRLFESRFRKYKENYFPAVLTNYFNITRNNAKMLEKTLKQDNLFSYFSILLRLKQIHYDNVDVDGYIRPKEIYKIVHFTPTELVCKSYGWLNDKAQKRDMLVTIELNNNNNLEDATIEILNICRNYEKETQTRNEINSLFSSMLSNELVKELAIKYNGNGEISKPILEENYIRIFTKCILEESNNIHLTYYDKSKTSHSYSDKIYYKNDYIYITHNHTKDILTFLSDLLVYLRKRKNLCQQCGGEFKGIFSKVCSKCGKPKDYY